MIITKNPELRKQVFDTVRNNVVSEREGTHISDLLYCLRKSYFRKKGLSPEPTDEQCMLWITGYAFQAYLFPVDKEISQVVDNIWCTPDIPTGIEVKSTRQSSKRFDLDSMEHWKAQILGYCKALGKLEYDLVVLFLQGNYSPPFPNLDCWHIQTTQEEVDDNWGEFLFKAFQLEVALKENIPPEPTCADWEWGYCESIELCPDTVCYRKMQLKKGSKKK